MRDDVTRTLPPRLILLSALHFTMDAYASFFTPLLPLMMLRLHLSLTLAGTLVALASITSSFAQPVFGWASDRVRRPWFITLAPLVSGVFLSAIGLAHSFGWLVALLMLGGLGAAAFHPQGALFTIHTTPRRSLAMSVFVSAGTLGFALGPLFSTRLVAAWGLEHTWVAAGPGIAIAIVLALLFPRMAPPMRSADRADRPAWRELRPVARPLMLLYLAVVFRSAVSFGFASMLPILLHARGFSLEAGGNVLTAYLLAGAVGGFAGGWMSGRIGGRRVVVQSFAASLPLFVAFLVLPIGPGIACLVAAGFVLQGSLPVNVVLGQELSPRHASTISSLLMGFAWGVGQLFIGPTAALGDRIGLKPALGVLCALCVAGAACALALPVGHRARTPSGAPLAAENVVAGSGGS